MGRLYFLEVEAIAFPESLLNLADEAILTNKYRLLKAISTQILL